MDLERKQISGARSDRISRFFCAQESAQLSCWLDWPMWSFCSCSPAGINFPARKFLPEMRSGATWAAANGKERGEGTFYACDRCADDKAEVSPSGCRKSEQRTRLQCSLHWPWQRSSEVMWTLSGPRKMGEGGWEQTSVRLGVHTGAKTIWILPNDLHIFTTKFQI